MRIAEWAGVQSSQEIAFLTIATTEDPIICRVAVIRTIDQLNVPSTLDQGGISQELIGGAQIYSKDGIHFAFPDGQTIGTPIADLTLVNQGEPIRVELPPDLERHRPQIENGVRDHGFEVGRGKATLTVRTLAAGWVDYLLQTSDGRQSFYEKKGVVPFKPRHDQLLHVLDNIRLPAVVENPSWTQRVTTINLPAGLQ